MLVRREGGREGGRGGEGEKRTWIRMERRGGCGRRMREGQEGRVDKEERAYLSTLPPSLPLSQTSMSAQVKN